MSEQTMEHTHVKEGELESQPPSAWWRVYIANPNHRDDKGNWKPQLLAGGGREHCEAELAAYRKKNFAATQWQAKFIEIDRNSPSDPKVVFD